MKSFLDSYCNEIQGDTVGINFFHIFKSRYPNAYRRKSFCLPEDTDQETALQPVFHDAWKKLYPCRSL